jgi:ribosomal protein S18 acetylase RimI-like enzyme
VADEEKLKRERAGTYVTADGRFTVEQSTSGWLLLDAEQTNELGLPLARGPFPTLDEARGAIGGARSGPRPISDLGERRAAKQAAGAATPKRDAAAPHGPRRTGARKAPARATGHELVIREIRTADGDSLRALWKSVGFHSVGDDDRSLGRLARRNPGLALVATEGGRIIASALGAWDGRRGWIYHVATAESHRRRGVATKLLDQVERGLRDIGCEEVRVNVGDENAGARSLWEARGYKVRPTKQLGRTLEPG